MQRFLCFLLFLGVGLVYAQDPPPSLPSSFFLNLKPAVAVWYDSDKQRVRADFEIGCYTRSWCHSQPFSLYLDCQNLVATAIVNVNESSSICYHAPEFALLVYQDRICPLEANPLLQLMGWFYDSRDFLSLKFKGFLPYGQDGLAEMRHWIFNSTKNSPFYDFHYYDTKKGEAYATRTDYYSFYYEDVVEPCPSFEPIVPKSECKNLIPSSVYSKTEKERWLNNPQFEGKSGLALVNEFFRMDRT